MRETLHATCIAIGGKGVLLLGHSGSGKSDLALRLIDGGATLVGDDQVELRHSSPPLLEGSLLASPCERIRGMIEARGVGILHMPFAENVPLALAIKLSRTEPERLPAQATWEFLGIQIPLLYLGAFDASTPAKIRLFLKHPKE